MDKTNSNAVYEIAKANAGLVKRIEALENQLQQFRWIPVDERLPDCKKGEETGPLLYQMVETGTIEVGYYGRGGKFRDSYFRHYRNVSEGVDSSSVVAWMPLPEPYKSEVRI